MVHWIAEVCFIGVTSFIGYVICLAVERKTIAQLIAMVAILLCLQATIEGLTPVIQRWSARVDSLQSSLDRVSSIGQGTWKIPMEGTITQGYSSNNHGIDIGAPLGTEVVATKDGQVSHVGWHDIYGNMVIVDHGGGMQSVYAHLGGIDVKVGYPVIAGTRIGSCGSTGRSTGPHLHFEIRRNGATVDPTDYVKN